ncbi:MAG: aspartyl protease family protein [Terriglobales bacterium]
MDTYISLPQQGAIRPKKIESIIDSGANDCIFHAQIAERVGFDVKKGKVSQTYGVDGKSSVIYFHSINLFAPGGVISITAAFSYELPIAGILGMRGFFDHFKIVFDPAALRCELERVYHA